MNFIPQVHSDFVVAATRGAMAVIDGNIMAIKPGEDAKLVFWYCLCKNYTNPQSKIVLVYNKYFVNLFQATNVFVEQYILQSWI